MIGTSYIRDLATQCRIGCDDVEREAWQPVIISVTCETDMAAAVRSDTRRDCVDYVDLHRIVLELAGKTQYRLLESLAHAIAVSSLELAWTRAVTVDIRKPHKLSGCASVGISLTLRDEELS